MTLVALNQYGVARYSHEDINACRRFLEGLGMRVHPVRGWEGNGWTGVLTFHRGQHHAAAWK